MMASMVTHQDTQWQTNIRCSTGISPTTSTQSPCHDPAAGMKRSPRRKMKKILLLEDMEDRVVAFRAAITKLADVEMVLWRDAGTMIRDLPEHLPTASVIS
jgi:hypothetical protein